MKYKFKNKNVLIVGFGKSGKSALHLLQKLNALCYVYDSNKNITKSIEFDGKFSVIEEIDETFIKLMDYMLISPGVSIFSECVKLAKLYGVQIIGEMELGANFVRGKTIAITGTNGKTTTTSLVHHILKLAKKHSVLCGNIGAPITENIVPFKANYVVETSSFQLESVAKFHANIGAIINITPNHLDRHLTFKNYAIAKFNIAKNMKKTDCLILNFDDENTKKYLPKNLKSKVVWTSRKQEIDGYFAKNGDIFQKNGKKITKIVNFSQTKLIGDHNITNILIATAICKKLKISDSVIELGIMTFQPILHRLQFVKNVNGVDYVNDSKSTSPDSTIVAINSFKNKPLILLLGGSDKQTNFDYLAKKISHAGNIKFVVVCGDTSKKIANSLKKLNFENFCVANNFDEALNLASQNAKYGDTVLLSPACASFDFFNCFEQRGERFCKYVENLKISNEEK